MSKNTVLTATQRIEGLETKALLIGRQIEVISQEIDKLSQAFMSLSRKLDATVKTAESGGISEEAINSLMVEQEVASMKSKIELLKQQNVLHIIEEIQNSKTFIVAKELDEKDEVVTPRVQFSLSSLKNPEFADKFIGKKAGDIIETGENMLKVLIEEIYSIGELNKQLELEGGESPSKE
jgi:hypothetical protein